MTRSFLPDELKKLISDKAEEYFSIKALSFSFFFVVKQNSRQNHSTLLVNVQHIVMVIKNDKTANFLTPPHINNNHLAL